MWHSYTQELDAAGGKVRFRSLYPHSKGAWEGLDAATPYAVRF